ncbi:hypothetical protein OE88DRAFT_1534592 [Heliocybe sulcata]|uniref:Uncharacterized protein n=1 Tax=Heliocybe sulcata TaxID=5364 RepID=A0A5C3N241_9AGAM|nr:hypothetical protein OE88DRAFT_1534592 [Heliocybe sulcata]
MVDETRGFQFSGGYAYRDREYMNRFERGAVPAETATTPTIRLVTQPQDSPTTLPHLPSIAHASDLRDHQTIQEKVESSLSAVRDREKELGGEMLLAKTKQIKNLGLSTSRPAAADMLAAPPALKILEPKPTRWDATPEWVTWPDCSSCEELSQKERATAVETAPLRVDDAASVFGIEFLGREVAPLPCVEDRLASHSMQGETCEALASRDGLKPDTASDSNLTPLELHAPSTVPTSSKTCVLKKSVKLPVINGDESVPDGYLSPEARAILAPTPLVHRREHFRILDEGLTEITNVGWRSQSASIPEAPPPITITAAGNRAALFREYTARYSVSGERVMPLILPWEEPELEYWRERARRNGD